MCQEGSRSIKFIMAYKKRLFHFVCIMFNIFNFILDKNASSKALSKVEIFEIVCHPNNKGKYS